MGVEVPLGIQVALSDQTEHLGTVARLVGQKVRLGKTEVLRLEDLRVLSRLRLSVGDAGVEIARVLEVPADRADVVTAVLADHGLGDLVTRVAVPTADRRISVRRDGTGEPLLDERLHDLAQAWDEVS